MLTSRELIIVMGLVVYGATLMVGSLFVSGSKVSLAVVLGVGLISGHLMTFLAGYVRFFKTVSVGSIVRHSEVVFFVGAQLLLLAQDLVPLRLISLGDKESIGNVIHHPAKKHSSLLAFQIMYSIVFVVGALLVMGAIGHIDFCPPHTAHGKKFNKVIKYGIMAGIVGSPMYSLSDSAGWHYTGTSFIMLSMIMCGIAFIVPRMTRSKEDSAVNSSRDIESYGSVN